MDIFISYAHKDNDDELSDDRWLNRLLEHLDSVSLSSECSVWSDKDLEAGDDWSLEIANSLAEAESFILLVSSAFLRSKYIRRHELPQILERRRIEGTPVVPIIVRPCAVDEAEILYPCPDTGPNRIFLTQLQSPATSEIPLSGLSMHGQDYAFSMTCRAVLKLLNRNNANPGEQCAFPHGLGAPPGRVNDVLKHWYAIQAANSQAFLHHLLARDNELRSQYREFCSEFIVSYLPGIAGRRYSTYQLLNHFAAIEQNIYSLLPPENRTVIKPLEAMILLLGIFCHDVGVKRCNEDSVAWPFEDHHEIGSELVREECQAMRIAPPLVNSVATLVRYHRVLPLGDVPEKHAVQGTEVRIQFLASLLRLADFLDYRHGLISATAPNIDAISRRSLSLRIDAERWTISIEGHAESRSEAKAALGLKYNIESILCGVKKVLAQNGLRYKTVGIDNNLIAPLLQENE